MLSPTDKAKMLKDIETTIKFDGMAADHILNVLQTMVDTLYSQNHHHLHLIASIIDSAAAKVEEVVGNDNFMASE